MPSEVLLDAHPDGKALAADKTAAVQVAPHLPRRAVVPARGELAQGRRVVERPAVRRRRVAELRRRALLERDEVDSDGIRSVAHRGGVEDLKALRMVDVVFVQERYVASPRRLDPGVARRAGPAVRLAQDAYAPVARGVFRRDVARPVPRPVVDADELPVRKGLRHNAFERGPYEGRALVRRHDDGYLWIDHLGGL